jgi:hypothetical protein
MFNAYSSIVNATKIVLQVLTEQLGKHIPSSVMGDQICSKNRRQADLCYLLFTLRDSTGHEFSKIQVIEPPGQHKITFLKNVGEESCGVPW